MNVFVGQTEAMSVADTLHWPLLELVTTAN